MAGSTMPEASPMGVPFNFLALPDHQSRLDTARVVVLPVPYDGTTSFRSGARDGPRAIVEASYNLEDYDPELDADISEIGIHTAPFLEPHMGGPLHMIERVREAVDGYLEQDKLVALIGGEHSVTAGYVQALAERDVELSVLYLDAHGDLRDEYMGTRWGHASVARRLSEICPLVQAGVRDLSLEEMDFIREGGANTFFLPPVGPSSLDAASVARSGGMLPLDGNVDRIIDQLTQQVYISIDLDVLDPSLMPAVGTPEPGGLDWHELITLLRTVAERRRIVGFDVMELSPREGPASCAYTAAKIVYKLIAYASHLSLDGSNGAPIAMRPDEVRDS